MSVKLRKTRIVGGATAEIVRPKHKRDPKGTDNQIIQAIKDLAAQGEQINEYRVWKYCSEHMYGTWSIGKVNSAVDRLALRGKIETEQAITGGRACRVLKLVP